MKPSKTALRTGCIAAVAATLSLGALPALAGGMAEPAPAPVEIMPAPAPVASADWTGFYAGAQLEYGDVDLSGGLEGGTGGLAGIFAGYRYDFGNYVIGGEIDLNAADIDLPGAAGTLDTVGRIGLEAGYDAGPALFYGTVGAARALVDAGANTLGGNGYFYGVGVDYALTDQVVLGAEVLRHEFEDFDNTPGLDVGATTVGISAALRF
jgi:opacity protein-like surface antigen